MEPIDLSQPITPPPAPKTAEEANATIARIHAFAERMRQEARSHADRLAQMDTQVNDLRESIRTLNAAATMRGAVDVEGSDERNLRRYLVPADKTGPGAYLRTKDSDQAIRLRSTWTRKDGFRPGLLDDRQPACDWHTRLLELVEQRSLVRLVRGKVDNPNVPLRDQDVSPISDQLIREHVALAPPALKRILAGSTGVGVEWMVDQILLPVLERDLLLASARRLEAAFGTIQMSGPTVASPFLTTGLRPRIKGTPATDDPSRFTASTPVTTDRAFTAIGLATRVQVDEDAEEDAVIDTQGELRRMVQDAILDGKEDAIINGDTTATHADTISAWNIRSRWGASGLGGTDDHRRAWRGLREAASDASNTTDQSGAKTFAGWLTARSKLAAPHGTEGDLITIVSDEYYIGSILGFAEVVTKEKYGDQATILTGEVAKLGGSPLLISHYLSGDMNASGVYDDVTKTKTGMILVNRARYQMGIRRAMMVESAKDITRGVIDIVSTWRGVFRTPDASTTKNVHYSYNL